jgi:hypothetical protein
MVIYKKETYFYICILLIFALVITSTFVAGLSRDERRQVSECNRECSVQKNLEGRECRANNSECRNSCRVEYRDCRNTAREDRKLCREECGNLSERGERSICNRNCSEVYYGQIRNVCDYRSCRNECNDIREECEEGVGLLLDECKQSCIPEVEFVPYNNYSISEDECAEAGGFYQGLCKGPYFRSNCTQDKYCICEGVNNYSCPVNYECVKEHGIVVRGRGESYQGWRTLLGEDMGDIGICGKLVFEES